MWRSSKHQQLRSELGMERNLFSAGERLALKGRSQPVQVFVSAFAGASGSLAAHGWCRRLGLSIHVLALVFPLAMLSACSGGELSGGVSPQERAIPVEVAEVRAQAMSNVFDLVGTLEADEAVVLRSEIAGVVKDILFQEGDQVTAGTLLITLDSEVQEAGLREARAQSDFARLDYERKQELALEGAISEAELDRARADLSRLKAKVDVLRARLAKTEIRAPFDGRLGARQVSPGDRVERDDHLVSLQAVRRLKVLFTVPERGVPAVKVGQKVKVKVSAFPAIHFPGEVYFVSPSLDPVSRRLLVKAYVANPQFKLSPGMFADVELAISENLRALTVPESSLFMETGSSLVYRVKEGRVERVRVDVGAQANGRVEIKHGLQEGDVVVSAGAQKLSPGALVAVKESAADESGKAQVSQQPES